MFEVIGILSVILAGSSAVSLIVYFVLRTIESWNGVSKQDYEWDKNYNFIHKGDMNPVKSDISSIKNAIEQIKSDADIDDTRIGLIEAELDIINEHIKDGSCKCTQSTKSK